MKFKVENTCLIPLSSEADSYLKTNTGREVFLEVEKRSRSVQQNKYLHKVFSIIGDELGYTVEEIKDIICLDINFKETYVNKFTGEVRDIRKKTRDLSINDFSKLTEQVIQWAAEHGISIMTPQEYFET